MRENLIFDVGCHIGEDADFYLKKGFRVVAVEANPSLCTRLKTRFANEINAGRFALVEKAISDRSGQVDFFIDQDASIWGTTRADFVRGASIEKITVPCTTFAEMVAQFGIPHYLKIDIEGADLLCLRDLSSIPDKPSFVSIEIEHRSFLREEIRLLNDLGYNKFKIIEQGLVPKQECPQPPLEGSYATHKFCFGSSGLFGKELPGKWLSASSLMRQYYRLLVRNRLVGAAKKIPGPLRRLASKYSTTWYDLHASL